jgi:DNA repair protein SbcD/Mre11
VTKLSVLHLADLHLGWSPAGLDPARAAERRRRRDDVLRLAVNLALQRKDSIRLVLVAGNLFSTHDPEPSVVNMVVEQLGRLHAAGIGVVTVPGHYDELTYPESVYRKRAQGWPGVLVRFPHLARVLSLQSHGLTVHVDSLAYLGGITAPQDYSTRLAAAPHDVRILLLHGDASGHGGPRLPRLDSAVLGELGYHYIALGSSPRLVREQLGSVPLVYPGQVEGRTFDEPGCGVFTVATWTGTGFEVSSEPVVVSSMSTLEVDTSAWHDTEELERLLVARAGRDCLLRICLRGVRSFALDVDGLRAVHSERYFYLELLDETLHLPQGELATWQSEPTVLGEFARRMAALKAGAPDAVSRTIIDEALSRGVSALRAGGHHE